MSEEVTNPHGHGFRLERDPSMLAAWQEASALKGKTVYDVNGLEMGKVTRAFAGEGGLTRIDVTLSHPAKLRFNTTQDVAGVPPIVVADVTEDAVKLSEAGERIIHPERSLDLGKHGARELPRKER